MIRLREYGTEEVMEFKNWRVAHYELDLCDRSPECYAHVLDHYCEMDREVSDFGCLIGKDCVLEFCEEINETDGTK